MANIARYSAAPIAPAQPRAADPIHVASTLRKRWKVVAFVTAAFVVVVGLITVLTPPNYTATVRLMAGRPEDPGPPPPGTTLPVLNALVLGSGVQSAETLAMLAQQRDIAARVIDDLKLPMTDEQLLANISVKPVVNTSLMTLSATARSRQASADVANAFARAFVAQEREYVRIQAVSALNYLGQELPRAESRMQQSAQRLALFQSQHGFFDANAREQDVVTAITQIDQREETLKVDRDEAKSLLANAQAQEASMAPTIASASQVGPGPEEAAVRAKLADVDAQLAAARAQYTSSHPEVIALEQERKSLLLEAAKLPQSSINQTTVAPNPVYQSLQAQVSQYLGRIDGDEAQLRSLAKQRRSFEPQLHTLPALTLQYSKLKEDATRDASVYNALAQRNNDALVAKTTAISDIAVVQDASAADAVRRPNLIVNLAIALGAGLIAGLASVWLIDWLERRKASQELARRLGLPLLTEVPNFEERRPKLRPWVQSMTLEAFLHLCVALRMQNDRQLRSLVILSPNRGDGKSTVSYHLAQAMSTMKGSVVLVDADLRRPTLHEKANVSNDRGLSEVLAGECTAAEVMQHLSPGLDLLTSGRGCENPLLVLERGFDDLMSGLREQYAMVVVDAPAVSSVTDGMIVAMHVDATVLVVDAGRGDERDADGVISRLSAFGVANVLGIVVNRQNVSIHDYSDYFAHVHPPRLTGEAS